MEKISYIVPTLNEVDNIEKTINKIKDVSVDLNLDFEIICIDAFSKDGTIEKIINNNFDNPGKISDYVFKNMLSKSSEKNVLIFNHPEFLKAWR